MVPPLEAPASLLDVLTITRTCWGVSGQRATSGRNAEPPRADRAVCRSHNRVHLGQVCEAQEVVPWHHLHLEMETWVTHELTPLPPAPAQTRSKANGVPMCLPRNPG